MRMMSYNYFIRATMLVIKLVLSKLSDQFNNKNQDPAMAKKSVTSETNSDKNSPKYIQRPASVFDVPLKAKTSRLKRTASKLSYRADCKLKFEISIINKGLFNVYGFHNDIYMFSLKVIEKFNFKDDDEGSCWVNQIACAVFTFAVRTFGQERFIAKERFNEEFRDFDPLTKDYWVDKFQEKVRGIDINKIMASKHQQKDIYRIQKRIKNEIGHYYEMNKTKSQSANFKEIQRLIKL